MPSNLPKFTFRVDQITLDKLRCIAEKNFRTTNKELEMVVTKHIADHEAKYGEIVIKKN